MDTAIKAQDTYFKLPCRIVAECHVKKKTCVQRVQAPHESVRQYIAALRDLVTICEFGSNLDEMLRAQLVECTNNPRLTERLLLEPDLTLLRAINLTTQIEAENALLVTVQCLCKLCLLRVAGVNLSRL